jgi:hypothetical protein
MSPYAERVREVSESVSSVRSIAAGKKRINVPAALPLQRPQNAAGNKAVSRLISVQRQTRVAPTADQVSEAMRIANQVRSSVDRLLNLLSTHHGVLRGTYEAAIAEAQSAQIVGSAGQTFVHIQSLEQAAASAQGRADEIATGLRELNRVSPQAANELGNAVRPLLQRANNLVNTALGMRNLVNELLLT